MQIKGAQRRDITVIKGMVSNFVTFINDPLGNFGVLLDVAANHENVAGRRTPAEYQESVV